MSLNGFIPRFDVVGLGECMVAFQPLAKGPLFTANAFEPHVVGAESNVCVGVVRLAHKAAMIGRVGADGLGEAILRDLRMEGVGVDAMEVDQDAQTAVQIRERRGFGASEFLYYRRDSAGSRLSPDQVRGCEALIAQASWLHVSGITLAVSSQAREAAHLAAEIAGVHGTMVSFDVNLRRKLWPDAKVASQSLLEFAARSDLVFAGEAEAAYLVGEGATDELGASLLNACRRSATAVLKLGDRGAISLNGDGQTHSCNGHKVPFVADVVGAGDAFAAGYISGRLDGLADDLSLERANLCGAFAVSAAGDTRGLPCRAEVQRLTLPFEEVMR